MNELSLFAGAGGGVLAGKLLGWRTVCAVERDAYAAQILAQRQNDGVLAPFPIWSDVCSFDGTRWRGVVDVVSGGFPCQDISVAGSGKGLDGSRSGLWKEMARIIREVRPRFVLVENSPALTSRGLGVVLGDLAQIGFDAVWGVLGADDVGANHKRKRIWILAYANSLSVRDEQEHIRFSNCETKSGNFRKKIPNTNILNVQGCHRRNSNPKEWAIEGKGPTGLCSIRRNTNWEVEPGVGRVADGVASRLDRLKALGNGQVSEVARTAWEQLINVMHVKK